MVTEKAALIYQPVLSEQVSAGFLESHLVARFLREPQEPTALMPGFWLGYCLGFWKAGFLESHLVTVTMIFEKASTTTCSNAKFLDGFIPEFLESL